GQKSFHCCSYTQSFSCPGLTIPVPSLSSQHSCSIPLTILLPPLGSLQQLHILPVLGPRAGGKLYHLNFPGNTFPPQMELTPWDLFSGIWSWLCPIPIVDYPGYQTPVNSGA
uniref:Uncharacterized protein n=1 Tax=Malurus cyaneus samueli TaxID=2593467 RepID=A0A8C5T2H3_9PASS